MKKELSLLDQVNMLTKHANRNKLVISKFTTYQNNACVYAECADGSYFTIFCFIECAKYIFKLV